MPVAYYEFQQSTPSIPFIVYYEVETNSEFADNQNYFAMRNINIELYTGQRDLKIEKLIEDFLDQQEIAYDTEPPVWLSDEKMFMTIYNFSIEKEY
jgi:hypothetical protein